MKIYWNLYFLYIPQHESYCSLPFCQVHMGFLTDALYCVALYHEYGCGVRNNKAKAIRWYRRAQATVHPGCRHALQRLRVYE